MVFASSPVRLNGSTRNVPPSISPTSRSALGPLSGAGFCVPPTILSVFSGLLSLGMKAGSTLVMSSGGGPSSPMEGISLAMVLLVLVMWGFKGLDFMMRLYSGAVSFWRSVSGTAWREVVVENGRAMACDEEDDRAASWLARSIRRAEDMVGGGIGFEYT